MPGRYADEHARRLLAFGIQNDLAYRALTVLYRCELGFCAGTAGDGVSGCAPDGCGTSRDGLTAAFWTPRGCCAARSRITALTWVFSGFQAGVPITSSPSCDQVIFVDQAADTSVSLDAAQVEVDGLG
jgi:hypothetical protein